MSENELILKPLRHILQLIMDCEKEYEDRFEAVAKHYRVVDCKVQLNPFGTFVMSLDIDKDNIADLIKDIEKIYSTDKYNVACKLPKRNKPKDFVVPKRNINNIHTTALLLGSVANVQAAIETLRYNVNDSNPKIKDAYAQELSYFEEVLNIANRIDYEVENNEELKKLETFSFLGVYVSHRFILDAYKSQNKDTNDFSDYVNVCKLAILLSIYGSYEGIKEKVSELQLKYEKFYNTAKEVLYSKVKKNEKEKI